MGDSVTIEAETGSLGGEWAVSNSSSPAYITITTAGAGGNPGSAARVATYNVTFPAAGTYELYARIRVGAETFNDDSLFYGNGFGLKSPTTDGDWRVHGARRCGRRERFDGQPGVEVGEPVAVQSQRKRVRSADHFHRTGRQSDPGLSNRGARKRIGH